MGPKIRSYGFALMPHLALSLCTPFRPVRNPTSSGKFHHPSDFHRPHLLIWACPFPLRIHPPGVSLMCRGTVAARRRVYNSPLHPAIMQRRPRTPERVLTNEEIQAALLLQHHKLLAVPLHQIDEGLKGIEE
ncbi:hypothetical protein FB45DRAFT_924157 [Roridomyces roridus]|uniref:Uncharacterized protein n=1 Tax=Roridomyces roridus TaxID=1738132 RepID=A0AAD7BM10_9AGAR|nr:hypothetical protein FB45DRAFT_924157 [Roridomyces roridus]